MMLRLRNAVRMEFAPSAPRRARPQVEMLEEKVVPSVSVHKLSHASHHAAASLTKFDGMYDLNYTIHVRAHHSDHVVTGTQALVISNGHIIINGHVSATVAPSGTFSFNGVPGNPSVHLHGKITLADGVATMTGGFTGMFPKPGGHPGTGTFTATRS
jgi:hypothetical protein